MRELKFYTFSVNDIGRDECLADFKALCGSYETGHTRNGPFTKWGYFTGLLRLAGRVFGLTPVKDSEIKSPIVDREKAYTADKAVIAHFIFLGEMKDGRIDNKTGKYGRKGDEEIV